MRYIICLLTCSSLLFACKAKHGSIYDYTGDKLIFGTGGGFSGKVTEYTLLSNGEFYSGTASEGNVYELQHNMKDRVNQMFKSYDMLGLSDLDINESGNITKYIIMQRKNENAHRIQWADFVEAAPQELKIYHRNLLAFAKEVRLAQKEESLPIK